MEGSIELPGSNQLSQDGHFSFYSGCQITLLGGSIPSYSHEVVHIK